MHENFQKVMYIYRVKNDSDYNAAMTTNDKTHAKYEKVILAQVSWMETRERRYFQNSYNGVPGWPKKQKC